jgi:hypothetical protein
MLLIWNAFWGAWRDSIRARVLSFCLLPFALMLLTVAALSWFYWERALDGLRDVMSSIGLWELAREWLTALGLERARSVLAPMILVFLATPVIAISCMLLVMAAMSAFLVGLVANRRFPQLQRRHGGSLLLGGLRALGLSLMALLALVVTIPLWLIPPLAVILPALIWGWLNYQVIWYDTLADHASTEERKFLARKHRSVLWFMGVFAGMLGALPGLLWAAMPAFLPLAPLIAPVAIWVYTWVYAFAVLWFAHYGLSALALLRGEPVPLDDVSDVTPVAAPPAELPAPEAKSDQPLPQALSH